MSNDLLIDDLTDIEAQIHIDEALDKFTRDLAKKIAADLDPNGLEPLLEDQIFDELKSNQEYQTALLDRVDGGEATTTPDALINEVGESVAKASARLVPATVETIIENYNSKITDVGKATYEHYKAQGSAVSAAKNYARVIKTLSVVDRAIKYIDSDYDPTVGLEQYLDWALAVWAAGAVGGLVAGSHPLLRAITGIGAALGLSPLIASFSEYTAQQVETAANGIVDVGNAIHAAASAIGITAGALINLLDSVLNALGFDSDLGGWFVAFWEATGDAAWMGSPLVLDLDADGIELVSLENSQVFWDIDEDGFLEKTGWVGADDGMLAIDLNGDGIITDHTELFGSITEDGFTALAVYDTNGDGVIDVNDAQFGDLLVWQDVNQNGISEASELYTLADLNIVSIDLNSTNPYEMYIEGNKISDISSFTIDDGVSGPQNYEIVDAWYQYDNRNTEFVGDYTLDLNSLFVTTVRGYGSLPDLHVSASLDNDTTDPNSLMSLLQDFGALSFDDLFADDRSIMDQVRGIMLRWAGADSVDPNSMGQWADAQELAFINALRGDQWLLFGNDPNPWSASAQGLQKAFEIALYAVTSKLVAQVASESLFNDGTYYNPATDAFVGFTAFNQDALDVLLAKSLDGTQVANKTEFWVQVVNMVDNSVGISNLTTTQFDILEATIQASDSTLTILDLQDKIAKNIEDQLSWTPDGDFIYGTSADDVYEGSIGDDFYDGGSGNDTLRGGIGNDILRGSAGNDILDGELGDDIVDGGNGDDTYLFFLGQGDDVVIEKGGNDKILFGPGITANDLNFIRVGTYDLTIQIDPTVGYGSLTIQGHFSGGLIETLEFDDGSTLDLNSLDYTYIGSSANETIYGVRDGLGGSGVDTLYGNGGDDVIRGTGVSGYSYTAKNTIFGGDGNDTLYADAAGDYLDGGADNDWINGGVDADTIIGGTGDDTLKGGRGNDTYIFNYGDGNDLIEENRDSDTILFGAGITAAMLDITRLNINDVIINIDGGLGGSIELNWQTYGTGYIVETVQFDDGSTLDLTSLDLTLNGTSASETLYGVRVGGSGVDTIYGNDGNDVIYGYRAVADYEDNSLYGGNGNDTIYGAYGVDLIYGDDGSDTIQGYNGNDTIFGGNGNDTLRGGNQDDVLQGGAGDDIIFGDNNDDILIGGLGIDQLTGGSGSDTFTFLSASSFDNVDTITDFNATYDAIDISDILVGYDSLTDAISDFIQITDNGTDSALFIDADGGADNFVQIATLNNVTGLTDEDALLTSGNLIAA